MNKRWMAGVLGLVLVMGAGADSLADWAKARENQKINDLTVGDWAALAQARSVQHQEAWYVGSAGVASFLVPGLGQFKTGDVMGGSLQLAGRVALVGGTFWGVWALLPDDLKSGGLTRDAKMDKWRTYWHDDPAKVAPAAGLAVGGMALSLIQSFWASDDAVKRAKANIVSGAVVFEPSVSAGFMGLRARM